MSVTILTGDAETMLRTLPDQSVQCCVTSPPYFALRDYGTAQWEGGNVDCDHKQGTARNDGGRVGVNGFHGSAQPDSDKGAMNFRSICGKCGAIRADNQIGLESTLTEYLDRLVSVFREVRRVLANDGCLWLNMGDCYEDKQLLGVPWELAFALRRDGWRLRSDIIWHKPNPMPESVTDRPTSAHEHIFLLSKNKPYYYDADAIREPLAASSVSRLAQNVDDQHGSERANGGAKTNGTMKAVARRRENGTSVVEARLIGKDSSCGIVESGANARNVWTIATVGFPGSHYAVFPTEIPRRCILAGTSKKGQCPDCGKPWERVTAKIGSRTTHGANGVYADLEGRPDEHPMASSSSVLRTGVVGVYETTGWQPSCQCDAGDPVPQTVLDPFAGAGTTGLVADRLDRNAILIELNPTYVQMARDRIYNDAPMFAEVTA